MRKKAEALCFVAVMGIGATGCGGKFFTWKAAPPAASLAGKVAIDVQDNRTGDEGGKDKRVVGSKPGFANIPTDIETDKPTDAADAVRDLVSQAAMSAGIGMLPQGDTSPTARIKVNVTKLYCNLPPFVMTATADFSADVSVLGMANDAPAASETISTQDTAFNDCEAAFKGALSKAYEKIQATLSSPAAMAAVKGQAAPAPTAMPTSAPMPSTAPAAAPAAQ